MATHLQRVLSPAREISRPIRGTRDSRMFARLSEFHLCPNSFPSQLWRFWHSMQGRWHRVLEETHRDLGDVIRVGPNELSFSSVSSVKTIYGNRTAENPDSPAPKNEWYDMLNAGFDKTCLVSERDPTKAGEKRALFSAAFTQKALLEQEGILQRCIRSLAAAYLGCLALSPAAEAGLGASAPGSPAVLLACGVAVDAGEGGCAASDMVVSRRRVRGSAQARSMCVRAMTRSGKGTANVYHTRVCDDRNTPMCSQGHPR